MYTISCWCEVNVVIIYSIILFKVYIIRLVVTLFTNFYSIGQSCNFVIVLTCICSSLSVKRRRAPKSSTVEQKFELGSTSPSSLSIFVVFVVFLSNRLAFVDDAGLASPCLRIRSTSVSTRTVVLRNGGLPSIAVVLLRNVNCRCHCCGYGGVGTIDFKGRLVVRLLLLRPFFRSRYSPSSSSW